MQKNAKKNKEKENQPTNQLQTPALANCKQSLFKENIQRESEDGEISLSKP